MRKFISSVLLFLLLISCEDERSFPATPSITFNRVEFRDGGTASNFDSLVVYIDFKDGDGDLGLSATQIDSPYNAAEYFFDDQGKLLTIRSRSLPQYAHLPPDEKPYNCTNYTKPDQVSYFPASWVDNTFNIVETKVIDGVTYKGLKDLVYFESNPNHYNIEVDFMVKNNDGTFTEYDWRKEFCNQTYDGRFPALQDGDTPLEGTLKYSMTSSGFKSVFSIRVMKLRITIKDRELHVSNTVESPEFTL
jgi:hypothetical protein